MNGNEILRDRHGNKLGEVVLRGSISTLHDKHGDRLGQYDTHDGFNAGVVRQPHRKRQTARHLAEVSKRKAGEGNRPSRFEHR